MNNQHHSHEWKKLIQEFNTFGGQVQNITQRQGPYGLGLFPINPQEQVKLLFPKCLLVPAVNVALKGDDVVIIDASQFPKGYDEWFRRYQASLS